MRILIVILGHLFPKVDNCTAEQQKQNNNNINLKTKLKKPISWFTINYIVY